MLKQYETYKRHSGEKVHKWLKGAHTNGNETGIDLNASYVYDANFNIQLIQELHKIEDFINDRVDAFYKEKLAQPIVVVPEKKRLVLADGNHRVAYAKHIGKKYLPAFVLQK